MELPQEERITKIADSEIIFFIFNALYAVYQRTDFIPTNTRK
tara:strand:+ start:798 stop:923 length:126 start_codon:yes stop_codon:yes gene_type:complete